jgi:hypothetical protein
LAVGDFPRQFGVDAANPSEKHALGLSNGPLVVVAPSWVQWLGSRAAWEQGGGEAGGEPLLVLVEGPAALQAQQLGWVPPSPAFLVRSALARRRLGRTTA